MKSALFTALVVLLALSEGVTQVLPTQPLLSGLQVGNRVEEYFGESYTDAPRQNFVFFRGEPITFTLGVRNMGARETALLLEGTAAQQLFRVEGFVAPTPPPGVRTERRVIGNKFEDEQQIDVPIAFSSPVKVWSGGTFAIQLERTTVIDTEESIEWLLSVPSAGLSPGLYRFTVRVNGSERGPRPLQGFGNFRFELREPGVDNQPELLRREALRRLSQSDFDGARRTVAALLRIHPNSYAAHLTLEMIADREGKGDEALKHREDADAILKEKRDALFLRYNSQRMPTLDEMGPN